MTHRPAAHSNSERSTYSPTVLDGSGGYGCASVEGWLRMPRLTCAGHFRGTPTMAGSYFRMTMSAQRGFLRLVHADAGGV